MLPRSLLVANRGEIAIRIMRAAAELGVRTVAVFSEDDARSLHTRKADEARALSGIGAAAYLDIGQMVAIAKAAGCDAIHPGYGFLSENASFARRAAEEGVTFVGPRPEVLELFGDKVRARELAERLGVPLLPGTAGATSLGQAREFLASLGDGGAMMVKAVAGGGGRGMRAVSRLDELDEAYRRCQSEARAAFGNPDVYVERLMPRARHLEVQVAGDGSGSVSHLWERECTIQRRNQKLVEVAPSPELSERLRARLTTAAVHMAEAVRYDSLGTFEFLLDADARDDNAEFAFIEANPRLQVEHTVTEEVTGIDLVKLQLQLAAGITLTAAWPAPGRYSAAAWLRDPDAHQHGVDERGRHGEALGRDADRVRSAVGARRARRLVRLRGLHDQPELRLAAGQTYSALAGAGFRRGGHARGSRTERVPDRGRRNQSRISSEPAAASRFRREPALYALRRGTHRRACRRGEFNSAPALFRRRLRRRQAGPSGRASAVAGFRQIGRGQNRFDRSAGGAEPWQERGQFDAGVDAGPRRSSAASAASDDGAHHEITGPENTVAVAAPMQGTIVSIDVREGELVRQGQQLFVMEAMKMEHVIRAHTSGVVRQIAVAERDAIFEGHPLAFIEEAEVQTVAAAEAEKVDLDRIRPDLAEVYERHAKGLDPARPEAVARRRKTRQRTARENVEDLCDPGTFVEYGALVLAAQRRRRALDDLMKNTPADGLVAGIGRVNGDLFEDARAQCVAMSYDYTVLAGTQGQQNHRKKDRMFEIAARQRLPVVFFTEGGGGRPGDTDGLWLSGLDVPAFHYWGKLSGLVPMVGINSGRCFAGNAALLGCCDVVIADRQLEHRDGRPGDGRGRRTWRSSAPRTSGR